MKKLLILLGLLFFSTLIFSQEGIVFKKESFNFSHIVRTGGIVKYRFNFTNKTKGIIRILGASSDCDFITVDWFKPSIERGEKGFIQIILDPSRSDFGKQTEKIVVYTNANQESPIVLTVMCNIVDKIPEPSIEAYTEYFGVMSDDALLRSKKYTALIESIANYVLKKESILLQVESSMSPMTIKNYSNTIAKRRADDFQTEIVKSLVKYDIDSKKIKFMSPKIVIQGPVYSKKMQGKSKECSKNQYLKLVKLD